MNYKVLYRKYRPNNFDSIVGQDYIIKTIKNSIISGNISHAYIFSGPRGTGKTTTAKVFAKAINCSNPIDGSPCGECEFCKNFVENPDIIEIDAASNNGVDEIRNLIDNIKLTPSNGKYKVYIIDEVHMLTQSAFNALLLTLEEPPSHVVFILATTNIESVPITILSRCQRFDFKKINAEVITDFLRDVCDKEKIKYKDDALLEIAYLSDGGMRDALSILDQISKNKEKITLELVESQFKTVSKKNIDDLINAIEENNTGNVIQILKDFKDRAVDYKNLVRKIIDGLSNKAKNIKDKSSSRLSFKDYKKLIIELSETLIKVNINIDSFIILEMILLDYMDNKEIPKPVEIREEESIKPVVVYTKKDNKDFVKIRINNCFVNAKKDYLIHSKKEIQTVIESVDINGKVKSALTDSSIVVASDEYIVLSCNNKRQATSLNNIVKEIENEIKRVINREYKLVFISEDDWNKEKEEYVNNIKNKISYKYIKEEIVDDNVEVNGVFDKSKVEII
jgi:DNA polymerase-3 subunit gamma/tau